MPQITASPQHHDRLSPSPPGMVIQRRSVYPPDTERKDHPFDAFTEAIAFETATHEASSEHSRHCVSF